VFTCFSVICNLLNPFAKVDALVGELMNSLKKAQVLDAINLIVTGLHGFAEVQTHSLLLYICFTFRNEGDFSFYVLNWSVDLQIACSFTS
jgi:hypothetical protein